MSTSTPTAAVSTSALLQKAADQAGPLFLLGLSLAAALSVAVI